MFSGININNLNNLIRKNNFYSDSIAKNKNRLIKNSNQLNFCYDGKCLNYLFSKIIIENNNIEKISNIVESYSDVLNYVKRDYQRQDINAKTQINHIDSKLQ